MALDVSGASRLALLQQLADRLHVLLPDYQLPVLSGAFSKPDDPPAPAVVAQDARNLDEDEDDDDDDDVPDHGGMPILDPETPTRHIGAQRVTAEDLLSPSLFQTPRREPHLILAGTPTPSTVATQAVAPSPSSARRQIVVPWDRPPADPKLAAVSLSPAPLPPDDETLCSPPPLYDTEGEPALSVVPAPSLWTGSGPARLCLSCGAGIRRVLFGRTAERVAVVRADLSVALFDTTDGRMVSELRAPLPLCEIAFGEADATIVASVRDADGCTVAFLFDQLANAEARARPLEWRDAAPTRPVEADDDDDELPALPLRAVACPRGVVAAVAALDSPTVVVFASDGASTSAGVLPLPAACALPPALALCTVGDSSRVIALYAEGVVLLWDAERRSLLASLKTGAPALVRLLWAGDGLAPSAVVVVGTDASDAASVRVMREAGGSVLVSLQDDKQARYVAADSNGPLTWAVRADGVVDIFQSSTGAVLQRLHAAGRAHGESEDDLLGTLDMIVALHRSRPMGAVAWPSRGCVHIFRNTL